MKFIVTCARALESILTEELTSLGLKEISPGSGCVYFTGGIEDAYKAIIWSRVGSRVALFITQADIENDDDLYAVTKQIDWPQHFAVTQTFAIDFMGTSATLKNTQYSALKIKDAIVDQFNESIGTRPNVDKQNPDVRIVGRLQKGKLTIGLELSDAPLHLRGYRPQHAGAPLRETLAAALLLKADWPALAKAGYELRDPMCGSGTLAIEAALIAGNIAPAIAGRTANINNWKGHHRGEWQNALDEAKKAILPPPEKISIFASDKEDQACSITRKNIDRGNLHKLIKVKQQDFTDCKPTAETGLLIFNPPYGDRLEQEDKLAILYADIGAHMRENYAGWKVAFITHYANLTRRIPLAPTSKIPVWNGKLACHFYEYDIYKKTDDSPQYTTNRARWGHHGEALANRLKKNIRVIGKQAKKQNISCYRLYDADLPEYNFALDRYEDELVLQEYAAPKTVDEKKAKERLQDAILIVSDVLDIVPEKIHLKVRRTQTRFDKYQQTEKQNYEIIVREHGAQFFANLTDYVDTGLFLDHRPVRHEIQSLATGKRFLNLFCYTGTATVHAGIGGCSSSVSVDLSKNYLRWAERNLTLNGLDLEQHELVSADCFEWLRKNRYPFDLIFLDPPTFSNSKKIVSVLDIQRDHVALIELAMKNLTPDGTLIFSTNMRKFVLDAAISEQFTVTNKTKWSVPFDYVRRPNIHQCYFISHLPE